MHLKSILALIAAISLIGGAAAQIQHHPFSELFPADQNLPFDGQNLTGATQLETASIIANDTDGNITFKDSTGGKTLIWNSNAVRWEVVNSDLDLNDNDVKNFFSGACGGGKVVDAIKDDGSYTCVSVSAEAGGTEGINATLAAGDIVNTTLYFNGNSIDNPGSIDNYFSGDCGSGEVVDSINADGSYSCVSVDAETGGTENLNQTLTAGNISNQSISMDGNDILNTGQVDGVELDNPGNAIIVSGSQYAVDSNSIDTSELASGAVNNDSIASFNTFTMQSLDLTSDLTGTGVVNSGQISSGAVGNSELASDSVNNDSVDNTVTLMIDGVTLTSSLDTNQNDLKDVANIYEGDGTTNFFGSCSGGQVVESISSDGSVTCIDPAEDVSTEGLNETLEAGSIANQTIFMNGNNLDNPGQVDGVNIESPGNALEVSSNSYAVSSNSIDTGELASSSVTNSELGSGAVNNDSISSFNTFTMQTLDLTSDLQGSSVVNSGQISSGAVGTSELATDSVTNDSIDNSATLLVNGATLTSDLDLNQNDLTDVSRIEGDDGDGNFFNGACGSGEVVDAINADGSYTCVSVSAEAGGAEGLNATLAVGDIANTTIKMNGNNIDNPGQVDGVNLESPGNAIEVSSNSYAVSTDSIGNSEVANSESITVSGLTSNSDIDLNDNAVKDIGTGATNITSSGKLEAGDDINVNGNNLNSVSSIDNGGSAVGVNDNLDMNGNSVTTSSGEVCLGDQCS